MAPSRLRTRAAEPQAANTPVETPCNSVMLEAPLLASDDMGYVSRVVNSRLTSGQAVALRRLFNGLRSEHRTLANGHHVDTQSDAIRWLLEQLSVASAM